MHRILSVGLTGGIASGKSAVSKRLAEHGAIIIDADILAREALEPGTSGLEEVVDTFGSGVLTEAGALDREALGQIVFADEDARAKLNAIVHPRVRDARNALRAQAPEDALVVEDIPLLVETGQADRFDVVVVVSAPVEQRLDRIVRHRNTSPEDAQARIDAQTSEAERTAVADVVLDNSGTLDDLHAQVDELYEKLHGRVSAQQ
ncbi:dephospho-CoA kinase [Nesterenkonia sandarakina]|uniref:Dephospho-CoA kinase n=1 Tax=Nesterenkonia sandarakina TaxID=272918 RepID=A0A2T0YEU7_9MICC|nr:dephospho-CoA kinase [Nesterenkonia sandarakina]PRZ13404.1 dephospho-CoA kinase [Nesterenkonia sandarakina]